MKFFKDLFESLGISLDAVRAAIAAANLKGVEAHRLVDLASKSAGAR